MQVRKPKAAKGTRLRAAVDLKHPDDAGDRRNKHTCKISSDVNAVGYYALRQAPKQNCTAIVKELDYDFFGTPT